MHFEPINLYLRTPYFCHFLMLITLNHPKKISTFLLSKSLVSSSQWLA